MKTTLSTALLVATLYATGCGNYTITFETARVINTYNDDDTSREVLPVDIVVLTKEEAERFPELLNGRILANEWFRARRDNAPPVTGISPDHIYALRPGEAGDMRDVLRGGPLISVMDRDDGKDTTSIKISHPQPGEKDAAIVIFGRFSAVDGIAPVEPVIIQPPPTWHDQIFITVDRKGMSLRKTE